MVDVQIPQPEPGRRLHAPVRLRPGGSATNVAIAAAAAGPRAAVVGRVGDDAAGRLIRAALDERGIDALLAVDPAATTGVVAFVGEGENRAVVADRGANGRLSPDDLPPRLHARAVIVSGYALLHEDTAAAAETALERAQAEWIAVDAGSVALLERHGPERFFAATAPASVLLANEAEAALLAGGAAADDAARALSERFALVVVKCGAKGAVAAEGGRIERVAAAEAAPEDLPGAGDAFAGALLAALAAGDDLGAALGAAARVGAAAARRPLADLPRGAVAPA